MAVTQQQTVFTYTGNGSATVFAYECRVLATGDLLVKVNDVLQTLGVDYTISGVGDVVGGSVTFAIAPANGLSVRLYRATQLERLTDYQVGGDFPAPVVNADFDRTYHALQDMQNGSVEMANTLRVQAGESIPALGNAAARANRVQAYDGSGNPLLIVGVDASSAAALNLDLIDSLNVAKGDKLIAMKRTSGIATTVHDWAEKQPINAIADFGCVADGVTNDTAALQAALTAAIAQKRALYLPGGTYLLTGVAGSDSLANGLLVPFDTVNPDPASSVLIYGDGGLTRLKANANNLVLIRTSRNSVTLRDLALDANAKTGCILVGIVPESMTQTTTLVSQSNITLDNVDRIGGAGCDGIVIQPGPMVAGDSGCFYINVIGGSSNFVGGGRHFHLKKNIDWGANPNRPTRVNFIGQRLLRGNAGYHLEVGSEINFFGCHEELINSGVTPLATPTARHISADCTNINFFGGYSEACTKSVSAFANNINSWGYIPASGSTVDWRTYANAWADGTDDSSSWTPVLVSSGGGAQGASTSTGKVTKHGKIVHVGGQVSVAKGTLAAGTLSITGAPFVADTGWGALQGLTVTNWSGITFSANVFTMQARISGATIELRKMHAAGAGPAGLTLAECADPVVFEVHGWYKAA